jgi:broad specificity phosphatase PhoE
MIKKQTKIKTNTKSTTVVSIDWIRHSHACSNLIQEEVSPLALVWETKSSTTGVLTNRGYEMAKYSRKCLQNRIATYDFCLSSFLPRALQTALFLFHNSKKVLFIAPWIHEVRQPLALGLDRQNVAPFKTVKEVKKFVNQFKRNHQLNVRVSYRLLKDEDIQVNNVPSKWYQTELPRIVAQWNQPTLKIGILSHGSYIRIIMKYWNYSIQSILDSKQEMKCNKKSAASMRCSNTCCKLGPNVIPNTSVWNQVLVKKNSEFISKKFTKYYVPPEDQWPFLSQDHKLHQYKAGDFRSCCVTKSTKNILLKKKQKKQ